MITSQQGWEAKKRAVLLRYALFQLPGLVMTAGALVMLRKWLGMPLWLAWTAMALWIAKDVVLFPLVWRSYLPGSGEGAEKMIGLQGEAVEPVDPAGKIRVHGELWRARLTEGSPPVERGEHVTVRGISGLTLFVEGSAAVRRRPEGRG